MLPCLKAPSQQQKAKYLNSEVKSSCCHLLSCLKRKIKSDFMVFRSIHSRGQRNNGTKKPQQEVNRQNEALADDSEVGSPSLLADLSGNHAALIAFSWKLHGHSAPASTSLDIDPTWPQPLGPWRVLWLSLPGKATSWSFILIYALAQVASSQSMDKVPTHPNIHSSYNFFTRLLFPPFSPSH